MVRLCPCGITPPAQLMRVEIFPMGIMLAPGLSVFLHPRGSRPGEHHNEITGGPRKAIPVPPVCIPIQARGDAVWR